MNGLRTELERTRDREIEAQQAAEEARETLAQLQSDSSTREREKEEEEEVKETVRRLEGELLQCRKTIEQGRSREQRLAREIQTVSSVWSTVVCNGL